jgi:hypothetical protein
MGQRSYPQLPFPAIRYDLQKQPPIFFFVPHQLSHHNTLSSHLPVLFGNSNWLERLAAPSDSLPTSATQPTSKSRFISVSHHRQSQSMPCSHPYVLQLPFLDPCKVLITSEELLPLPCSPNAYLWAPPHIYPYKTYPSQP